MARKKAKAKQKTTDRINDLVSETVDKITEVLDDFYKKAGRIATDSGDSERVEKLVERFQKIRKELSEGTGDAIKNITRTITDAGESIYRLVKRKKREEGD